MIEKREFYIDGQWVAPKVARDYLVIDPASEEPCAVISLGDQGDTDAAVAAAQAALPGWKATDPAERIAAVERIAEIYARRSDEMGQAISLEMGAPIDLARRNQTGAGAYHIANFIAAAKTFPWVHPLGDGTPGAMIAHEAVGVVGLITPWNWPMNQVTLKVIPAILAGCTMVLKPSEESPLSSLLFAEILDEAGPATRRVQSGERRWSGCGLAAFEPSRYRDDFVHRLDACGACDFQGGGRDAETRHAGAGRQGSQSCLCRRG